MTDRDQKVVLVVALCCVAIVFVGIILGLAIRFFLTHKL